MSGNGFRHSGNLVRIELDGQEVPPIALVAFAYGLQRAGVTDAGWLHGLKIAAVAVVANAVWGMARALAPDRPRASLAILSAGLGSCRR